VASQGYRDWLNAGRPYTLIRPAKAVQAALQGYGLTVYDYPNDAHLKANTPEDHTPFSVTGWPGTNRRWNARALDVMPRKDKAGNVTAAARKENADIARQLIRDRDGGHPGAMWIKYLNWTDEGGTCRQERWTDASNPLKRTTRSSTDKGHIHISGRSDVDNDDRADDYDPIARMAGQTTGDEMSENASRQVAAMFDMQDGVVLFTDGSGTRDPQQFGVPIVRAIKDIAATVDAVAAAATADEQRDKAALAAINSLVAAFQATGGSIDAAPIVAAVNAVREQTHADMVLLQQQLTESRNREVALQQELARVRAAAEANLSPAERADLPST